MTAVIVIFDLFLMYGLEAFDVEKKEPQDGKNFVYFVIIFILGIIFVLLGGG